MPNPWFRMYTDFLEDPKLLGLAFEDQRHFIGVLALKSSETIDQVCAPEVMDRIVAQKLWIDHSAIKEVKRRLIDADLIDEDWQPVSWGKRQRPSDHDPSNAERQRKYRESRRNALRNAEGIRDVTPLEEIREEEIREEEKKVGTKPKKRFRPPTIEEVAQYCTERKNGIDPELFYAHYESVGWKTKGGSKLESWKSAVITWEKRNAGNGRGNGNAGTVRIPTGNDMPSLTELGRICKDAGIPGDQLRGRQPDEIRSMLRERGIGQ